MNMYVQALQTTSLAFFSLSFITNLEAELIGSVVQYFLFVSTYQEMFLHSVATIYA